MTQPVPNTSPVVQVSRRARIAQLLLAGLGAFVALLALGTLANATQQPLLIGSFGATCVLLFGFPKGPFSRARNVIGGHLLCSCVGLACLSLFGPGLVPMALAGGLAVILMIATGTTHPPAGGNPVIIFLTQPGWVFALLPTLAGALSLVLIAAAYWQLLEVLERR